MTLIKSISGIRGTIGGKPNENLTPYDIVHYTSAFGSWLLDQNKSDSTIAIIIGRDARPSGEMIAHLVASTLQAKGIDVIDLGLATTPTVSVTVIEKKAQGGIILTASHNPIEWNALKLLNEDGEFISSDALTRLKEYNQNEDIHFTSVNLLGKRDYFNQALDLHINKILDIPIVNRPAIAAANFRVVVDGINSIGSLAVPELLRSLGVQNIHTIHSSIDGQFAHNPEPLPENLDDICKEVKSLNADLGIVVDPDVDRLAFITDKGEPFGEEYTLVAVADYVLKYQEGACVSNLSSSLALKDIAKKYEVPYHSAPVGELNVVKEMKSCQATIGGEGNGGVIFPDLHYGRDALVGIALFLSHLATLEKYTVSQYRATLPDYFMSKTKVNKSEHYDFNEIEAKLLDHFEVEVVDNRDGLKLSFKDAWVHIRPSNTEPILRIYSEAPTQEKANDLTSQVNQLLLSAQDN